jgi:predicted component of type VI protein secretion system
MYDSNKPTTNINERAKLELDELNFGFVPVGKSHNLKVQIKNNINFDLVIYPPTLPEGFNIRSFKDSLIIPANDSSKIEFQYKPINNSQSINDTINILNSYGLNHKLLLIASSNYSPYNSKIIINKIGFPITDIDSTTYDTIKIINNHPFPIGIDSFILPENRYIKNMFEETILPFDSNFVILTFTPKEEKLHTDSLKIITDFGVQITVNQDSIICIDRRFFYTNTSQQTQTIYIGATQAMVQYFINSSLVGTLNITEYDSQFRIINFEELKIDLNAGDTLLIEHAKFISSISNLYYPNTNTISKKAFKACSKLISIESCFTNNSFNIIEADLFKHNQELKSARNCFSHSNSLIEIDENLFKFNTKLTNIESCFKSCNLIREIGNDLFINNTKLKYVNNSFENCSQLENIGENLFSNCEDLLELKSCFRNCENLISILSKLFTNCENITNLDSCFMNCSAINSITSELLSNNNMLKNISYCFYNTSLKYVPNNFLKFNTKLEDVSYTFAKCYELIDIPSGIFLTNDILKKINYCFWNCNALRTIPAILFSENTSIHNNSVLNSANQEINFTNFIYQSNVDEIKFSGENINFSNLPHYITENNYFRDYCMNKPAYIKIYDQTTSIVVDDSKTWDGTQWQ